MNNNPYISPAADRGLEPAAVKASFNWKVVSICGLISAVFCLIGSLVMLSLFLPFGNLDPDVPLKAGWETMSKIGLFLILGIWAGLLLAAVGLVGWLVNRIWHGKTLG